MKSLQNTTDSAKDSTTRSVATAHSQRVGVATFQFADHRPEAVAQRKLQEVANGEKQPIQFATGKENWAKLKSKVSITSDPEKMRADIEAGKIPLNERGATEARRMDKVDQIAQLKVQPSINSTASPEVPTIQRKENKTGLPNNLKTGIENLSGFSMDDVRVHRNSDKPAQLQAHAYAQGTNIHLGPGQEKHLPHEAWHVVQQKQGRVKPTVQLKGKVGVNDDVGLEREADLMGVKALQGRAELVQKKSISGASRPVVQREDGPTVGGFQSDSIEGGGNFFELISDTYGAIETFKSGGSAFEKVSATTKAAGSGIATVVSGFAANEIEKGTACLESLSEGLKIFDACKEVGEAWNQINFRGDTYAQTFENLGGVLLKLGDVLVGGMKSVSGFVKAMEWLGGRIKAFADWAPLSEVLLKGMKFMVEVKKYFGHYISFKTLKVVRANLVDATKRKAAEYLIDEQWSRLKNGVVTVASTFTDFAADTAKYMPALGINVAWAASLGAASKVAPLLHSVGTGTYDMVRQGWRNVIVNYAPVSLQGLAATDKANLGTFRTKIVDFVMGERAGPNSVVILGSLGLGQSVKGMGAAEASAAIEEAVSAIK